jgi:orotate phosphoribosyltransferase
LFESDPKILTAIIKEMKQLVPHKTEVIAGLEMGGIPLVTALSIETGIISAFVRKTAKEYGTCKIAEGAEINGKNVCVIEDVVTTGGQIIKSVQELRNRGAKIDTVLCVILRNPQANEILAKEDLSLKSVLTMEFINEAAGNEKK